MALLVRDECLHHLGVRGVSAHANYYGAATKSFMQALYLSVAAAKEHDVVGKGEVGHMDVGLVDAWYAFFASRILPCFLS